MAFLTLRTSVYSCVNEYFRSIFSLYARTNSPQKIISSSLLRVFLSQFFFISMVNDLTICDTYFFMIFFLNYASCRNLIGAKKDIFYIEYLLIRLEL